MMPAGPSSRPSSNRLSTVPLGTQTAGQLVVGLRDIAHCGRSKAAHVVTGLLYAGRLIDVDGRSIKSYRATVHKVGSA